MLGEVRVSVVLPTRNRAQHARECAETILANDGLLDLMVVDQSDTSQTEDALGTISDPRLSYVRTDTRGVTISRNLGIDRTRGEIVAFTDDDCRVASNWARTIASIVGGDPEAAVVCGRVYVPDEIREEGFA